MAAVLERTGVGVQDFGINVRVPDHPKAKLMYYFDCICTVLDLSDQENLCRLRYIFMIKRIIMRRDMRFPAIWYVRTAKAQTSLRTCAVWSEPLLVA